MMNEEYTHSKEMSTAATAVQRQQDTVTTEGDVLIESIVRNYKRKMFCCSFYS